MRAWKIFSRPCFCLVVEYFVGWVYSLGLWQHAALYRERETPSLPKPPSGKPPTSPMEQHSGFQLVSLTPANRPLLAVPNHSQPSGTSGANHPHTTRLHLNSDRRTQRAAIRPILCLEMDDLFYGKIPYRFSISLVIIPVYFPLSRTHRTNIN